MLMEIGEQDDEEAIRNSIAADVGKSTVQSQVLDILCVKNEVSDPYVSCSDGVRTELCLDC